MPQEAHANLCTEEESGEHKGQGTEEHQEGPRSGCVPSSGLPWEVSLCLSQPW